MNNLIFFALSLFTRQQAQKEMEKKNTVKLKRKEEVYTKTVLFKCLLHDLLEEFCPKKSK